MREKYVDIMKGIAMLAIMSVHLPQEYVIINYGLSFMVPTFFVVSGFFLPINKDISLKKSLTIWYHKKGRRLLLAYCGLSFWSGVISTCVALIRGTFNFFSTMSLVYQTISGLGILTLWFLPALIIGEIIVIILRRSCMYRSIVIGLMTILVLIFSHKMTINGVFGQACYDYSNPINMICVNIMIVFSEGILASFFINLGKCIKSFLDIIKKYKVIYLISIGVILEIFQIIISQNMLADIHYMNMTTPFKYLFATILGVLGVTIFSMAIEKVNIGNFLAYIGKNSLFFMGTHHNFMLTDMTVYLMKVFGIAAISSGIVKFIFGFSILLCIDLIFFSFCKQVHIIKYLFWDIREKK